MTKMQQVKDGRTEIKSNGEEKFEYYENGNKKKETSYTDGIQDGMTSTFYENGQKSSEQNYVNGKLHGYSYFIHPNRKLKSEQTYINGELCSRIDWYDSARLEETFSIENGKKTRSTRYRRNTKHEYECEYKDDKRHGSYTEYDKKSGHKSISGQYKDGKKDGVWSYWSGRPDHSNELLSQQTFGETE